MCVVIWNRCGLRDRSQYERSVANPPGTVGREMPNERRKVFSFNMYFMCVNQIIIFYAKRIHSLRKNQEFFKLNFQLKCIKFQQKKGLASAKAIYYTFLLII